MRPLGLAESLVVWLFVACAPAREPEATVVDVVVSAPAAGDSAASAIALTTVTANPTTGPNLLNEDNPRRVLQLPPMPFSSAPSLPFPGASSLPPQTAVSVPPSHLGMLSPVFSTVASSHTAGSTPDGQPLGGQFKAGDTLHLPITLQPGRCYTIVAVAVGITELDIALMISVSAAIPLPPTPLAVDNTSGPTAVIGSGANCFKNPTPIPLPAVAVVRATTGSGAAVAQAFSR